MQKHRSISVQIGVLGWCRVIFASLEGQLYYVRALPVGHDPWTDPQYDWIDTPVTIVDFYVEGGGQALTAQTLRNFPLGGVETLVNTPSNRFSLGEGWARGVQLGLPNGLPSAFTQSWFDAGAITATNVTTPTAHRPEPRPALSRPETTRLTRAFLEEVAACYLEAVAKGERPLVAIEREAGVPRNTAARWVAKSRAAGVLAKPPRRQVRQ